MRQYFEETLEELQACENKMEQLKLIVEFGKDLEDYPEDKKQEKFKVPGCISNVYLYPEVIEDGTFYVHATSDALIVAGYLSLILDGINGRYPKEIVENWSEIEEFTRKAGFKENLSPTRANAFGTILHLIYSSAQAHLQ